MSDNKDIFEKQFHTKFQDFELPVSDVVLNNIKKAIEEKKKKKTIAYWKWISVLIIISAIGGYLFFSSSIGESNKTINKNTIPVHIIAKDSNKINKLKPISNKNETQVKVENNTSINDNSKSTIISNNTKIKPNDLKVQFENKNHPNQKAIVVKQFITIGKDTVPDKDTIIWVPIKDAVDTSSYHQVFDKKQPTKQITKKK